MGGFLHLQFLVVGVMGGFPPRRIDMYNAACDQIDKLGFEYTLINYQKTIFHNNKAGFLFCVYLHIPKESTNS